MIWMDCGWKPLVCLWRTLVLNSRSRSRKNQKKNLNALLGMNVTILRVAKGRFQNGQIQMVASEEYLRRIRMWKVEEIHQKLSNRFIGEMYLNAECLKVMRFALLAAKKIVIGLSCWMKEGNRFHQKRSKTGWLKDSMDDGIKRAIKDGVHHWWDHSEYT